MEEAPKETDPQDLSSPGHLIGEDSYGKLWNEAGYFKQWWMD